MSTYHFTIDAQKRVTIRVETHNHDSRGEILATCHPGVTVAKIKHAFALVERPAMSRKQRMYARHAILRALKLA